MSNSLPYRAAWSRTLFQRVQGYADAVFAGFTKTAADGRKVIYPWGVLGRGYVLANEDDEKRLRQLFAVYLVVVTVVMAVAFSLGGYLGGLGAVALMLLGYAIYAVRLTARMEPTGERLPLIEAYRAQACSHSSRRLWSWTLTGIFLVCLGALMSVLTPENRTGLAFLIVVGIFCAAFGGWMLLLRRGAPPPAVAPPPPGQSAVGEELAFYITGDIGPIRAWFITIFGVVFSGLGIFLFIVDPAERSTWAGMALLCGLLAAWGIAMLVLRHREHRRR